MARDILAELGLSKDAVKRAIKAPVAEPTLKLNTPKPYVPPNYNYLYSEEQKRIKRRLQPLEGWICAKYLEGFSPTKIALLVGVSEECIRVRLRRAKLFNSGGRRGRPPEETEPRYPNSPHRVANRAKCP